MVKFVVLVLSIFLSTAGYAHVSIYSLDSLPQKHAVTAAQLCQNKKFDDARAEVDLAIHTELESNDPYTWYIRGYIYKELYKLEGKAEQSANLRETAVMSLLKSHELSPTSDQNNDAALSYLASTYFRDALLAATDFHEVADSTCFELFEAYRNIQSIVGSIEKVNAGYVELLHTRCRSLLSMHANDRCNEVLFLEVKRSYEEILSLQKNDCIAMYNLAITFYNTAVFSNDALPDAACYDAPEREQFLENALNLLKEMESNCDDKPSAYRALANVLRASNRAEEATVYDEKLKGSGAAKDK
ncbi:MAG: hypothetical protein IPP69_00600 [Flavobacteriales bacterium]|nr:hypothetical protein [Flavobacteriales bacterium]